MKRTSEVLNEAADLIERRGWTRGVGGWAGYDAEPGPLCLEGGIMAALGITNDSRAALYGGSLYETCPAYEAVANYLNLPERPSARLNTPSTAMAWWWNDQPGRTAAEVIEVLRAAAVIEAAKEAEPVTTAEFPEFAAVSRG